MTPSGQPGGESASSGPDLSASRIIAILGPGLLGGSIAMAVKKRLPGSQVRIWARRPDAVSDLQKQGLCSLATTSVIEAAQGSSLIVLAVPVDAMPALAREIATAATAPGCIVTDVGSVKGGVVSALEAALHGTAIRFVGSHPMAGSEKTGISAARADLFEGARCLVTPTGLTDPAALADTISFWKALGCEVLPPMSPAEHDRKVARISHLPHLLAAVATLAALRKDASVLECGGNGFRDTTRVAAGDPGLWAGIVKANRAEVAAALRDARERLAELLEMVDGMNDEALRRFLAEAKALRDRLPAGRSKHGDD